MSEPSKDRRTRRMRVCACIVALVGLFNLVIVSGAEYIQPWMYKDVLATELNGLNCKEEASRRVIDYMKRTSLNRIVFPATSGCLLLATSVVMLLSIRNHDFSNS